MDVPRRQFNPAYALQAEVSVGGQKKHEHNLPLTTQDKESIPIDKIERY